MSIKLAIFCLFEIATYIDWIFARIKPEKQDFFIGGLGSSLSILDWKKIRVVRKLAIVCQRIKINVRTCKSQIFSSRGVTYGSRY